MRLDQCDTDTVDCLDVGGIQSYLVFSSRMSETSASLSTLGEPMGVTGIVPQLRTTDMASSIHFYTEKLGFSVEFNYQDFYTGIRAGGQVFHLKLVDEQDPSILFVDEGEHFHLYFQTEDLQELADRFKANEVQMVKDVHETDWNTREFVIQDDQGHTLYFGESL